MSPQEHVPPVVLPEGLTGILLLGTVERLARTLADHNQDDDLLRPLGGVRVDEEEMGLLVDAYRELAREGRTAISLLERIVGSPVVVESGPAQVVGTTSERDEVAGTDPVHGPPVVLPDGLSRLLLLGTVARLAGALARHSHDLTLIRALGGHAGFDELKCLVDRYFEIARESETALRLLDKVVGRRAG